MGDMMGAMLTYDTIKGYTSLMFAKKPEEQKEEKKE
jgi:hypothetical protein